MFRDFLISIYFVQSQVEPCDFTKEKLIIAIFVDDTLSTGPANDIQQLRTALHAKFKISKDGGNVETSYQFVWIKAKMELNYVRINIYKKN